MNTNRKRRKKKIEKGAGDGPYIVIRLEVLGDIQLVLANRRARPAAALELIEHPAAAVVVAGVLVVGDLAVDLGHGVDDVLDVLLLGDGDPARAPVARRVRGEDGGGPRAVEAVRRVADRPDPGRVGRGRAAPEDRVLVVLPEPRLVLQRYLARRLERQVADRVGDAGGESWGVLVVSYGTLREREEETRKEGRTW